MNKKVLKLAKLILENQELQKRLVDLSQQRDQVYVPHRVQTHGLPVKGRDCGICIAQLKAAEGEIARIDSKRSRVRNKLLDYGVEVV